jgi:hypothetical protein
MSVPFGWSSSQAGCLPAGAKWPCALALQNDANGSCPLQSTLDPLVTRAATTSRQVHAQDTRISIRAPSLELEDDESVTLIL